LSSSAIGAAGVTGDRAHHRVDVGRVDPDQAAEPVAGQLAGRDAAPERLGVAVETRCGDLEADVSPFGRTGGGGVVVCGTGTSGAGVVRTCRGALAP